MGEDDVPLDDKSKRMRDLLSSFYSPDHPNSNSMSPKATSRFATLDTINTTPFDADQYMNLLVQKSNLEGLLQRHVEMAAEIKNLDTDLQMLVYENYNKFVSATDAIKRMNNNIVGMETNMEQLLEKIMSVQSRSDGVNTSLFEKREHIEKLHRTRNLLRKVQFIYDLPARLAKCIKSEAYADAVKYYTGAMPIFKAYGNSSFQDCKRASEEAIAIIIKALQGKVFSDSESIQARAEAVMLLKQLDFPVNNLKVQLFGKLEEFLVDLHLESKEIRHSSSDLGGIPLSPSSCAHEASIREFAEAVRAYRVIFPDSEQQLFRLAKNLATKHFEATQQHIKKQLASADLVTMLRVIWTNVLLMDEVLPEAGLRDFTFEAAHVAIKQYFACRFSHLLLDISGTLVKVHDNQKGVIEEEYPLQAALEISKNALVQGSMDALLDFRRLLDENLEVLSALTDLIIDWVQEGFQEFFRKLSDQFLVLSRKKYSANQDLIFWEGMQGDKVLPGLVLLLAQLSVFIEQNAITRISEEISPFSGSGYRGHDNGPAFVPAEICRIFQSAGEELLQHYISLKTRKILILLKKRFITPNWVKHKEPREVHMFIDLLLQELDTILNEVKQILPEGLHRKHRRTDSNGSNTSSRSNPLRDDKLVRSNTQKARSQLLESHLAKLFKQKMEIFTKVEHTQESVITTIIKLFLKSLQEFVRLQTFNRSGFQQIQLDIHFLKTTLKDTAEDEAAVDFLLDEVIVAAAERCLDPIPLEPAIVDRLTQAKLAKNSEQSPTS
ncbi:vacuolar protein sorting-associated protein 51 homolog isoform X1 [Nicotiana tomentosiformis]|uniref:vacuolar protein sorting-associated protein 51 homolog isoform X1 n=1 Tax=Nicotiana tomentosiformis TaxID=4098 RepID=UPI00051C2031|nr:vacuolar protein sorting-associated protein 51 homolog isoform X1 [Nicotiana tomentosiformis]